MGADLFGKIIEGKIIFCSRPLRSSCQVAKPPSYLYSLRLRLGARISLCFLCLLVAKEIFFVFRGAGIFLHFLWW
jgi:hypothetical protein